MAKLKRDQDYGAKQREMNKRIVHLQGAPASERVMIENKIRSDIKPIFVLQGVSEKGAALANYIDQLHDERMSNELIHQFKVCREISFENHVTLVGQKEYQPKNMTELLNVILEEKVTIIIENNSRTLLANILQQLIYIEYPTDKIDIKLRKEFKDAEKTRRFMLKIESFLEKLVYAREQLGRLDEVVAQMDNEQERQELFEIVAKTKCSYLRIQEQLDKAKNVEMKIAMAASKKTGKSVLANSMIGMELAPTSLEMATPNNCIYKKSKDHLFRLKYQVQSGEMNKIEKESREEIHSYISDAFKKAQQDADNKYTIPDMEIQYVSNKNNFESYTIYDTPGPDLAGAEHFESAERAIKVCDVALFAIDYSKFLTNDEANFLKKVRGIFENNQKYHTLMFTINKIDMALQDNAPQSRIKSIDFIRNRIIEVGDVNHAGESVFQDCVIFATSARDYFYTLELEDAVREKKIDKEFLEEDLYELARAYAKKLRGDDSKSDLRTLLGNIDSEATRLVNNLGHDEVTIDTIREYSGMPQLLSYISYVTKSKAREEIVNSITYIIDREMREIQRITDEISNIEKLMSLNEESKNKIIAILNEYSESTKSIMSEGFQKEDISFLERNDEEVLLSNLKKCKERNASLEQVNLKMIGEQILNDMGRPDWRMFRNRIVAHVKVSGVEKIRSLKQEAIKLNKKGIGRDRLVLSQDDLKGIIASQFDDIFEYRLNVQKGIMEKFIQGLEDLLKQRIDRVKKQSEVCRQKLDKEDCFLILPALPNFDMALSTEMLRTPEIKYINLEMDLGKSLEGFGARMQFWRNLFNKNLSPKSDWQNYKEVKVSKIDDKSIVESVGKFAQEVDKYLIDDLKVDDEVEKIFEGMKNSVQNKWNEIKQKFEDANEDINKGVEEFRNLVDDSEKYAKEISLLSKKKKLIDEISASSRGFLNIWGEILQE